MDIDDVVGTMRRAGDQVPQVPFPIPLQAPRWGPRASDAEVSDLEAEAGRRLPSDYRMFLLQYGSVVAMDVFDGYDIFDARRALALTRTGEGPRFIDTAAGSVPVVTIGGDGGGDLFVLVVGSGGVYKWLHELGVGDQRVAHRRALERVGDDFTAFLRRVAEEWQRFVASHGTLRARLTAPASPAARERLVLLVVPLGQGQPDDAAGAVIDTFAATGFEIVMHHGRVDESVVGAQARAVSAAAILLCPGALDGLRAFAPLVRRVRASNDHPGSVFDVLAVGRLPDETLEGDRGAPFFIHPSEGEARMSWLARLVASAGAHRP